MANTEFHESIDAVRCQQSAISCLSDYAMVRQSALLAQTDDRSRDSLLGNGMLPAFEIKDSSSQQAQLKATRPLKGTDITTRDMKDSGVSAAQEKDGDSKTTNARYPGGIEVSTSNGKTLVSPEGDTLKVSKVSMVQVKPPLHEAQEGGRVYIDGNGKAMVKVNRDGTVTVDTGKGFYTQSPDGVEKVHAIRSRDGKDFTVVTPQKIN